MSLEEDLKRYYDAAEDCLKRINNRDLAVPEDVMASRQVYQYVLAVRDLGARLLNPKAESSRLDYALGLEENNQQPKVSIEDIPECVGGEIGPENFGWKPNNIVEDHQDERGYGTENDFKWIPKNKLN